jgi:hypothetical protein
MSLKIFRGGAAPQAKAYTWTIGGTIEVGDQFRITIGSRRFVVSVNSTVAADVATQIANAINTIDQTRYPEFSEVIASSLSAVLTISARIPGEDFSITADSVESDGTTPADGQTITAGSTTASKGPKHWDDPNNWAGGSLPVDGDDILIEDYTGDILYGLDQSPIDAASLTLRTTMTGRLGLAPINENGYPEYREKYLKIKPTVLTVEAYSPRIMINTLNVQNTITVRMPSQQLSVGQGQGGLPAFLWVGTGIGDGPTFELISGSVGIAILAGESANLTLFNMGGDGNTSVLGGGSLDLVELKQIGGSARFRTAPLKITKYAGDLVVENGDVPDGFWNYGGKTEWLSDGDCDIYEGTQSAEIWFTKDLRARTFGSTGNPIQLHRGTKFKDSFGTVALPEGYQPVDCKISDVDVDLGNNRIVTVA